MPCSVKKFFWQPKKPSNELFLNAILDKTHTLISWPSVDPKSASVVSTEGSESEVEITEKLGQKLTTLLQYSDTQMIPPKSEISDLAYNILGCKVIPNSDFSFYLSRISKYTSYEDSIFITAAVLIKRSLHKIQGFDPKLLHK